MALDGSLTIATLLVLGALKLVATLFSCSSGGAGGVFAPSLFIGAMLGGAMGWLQQQLLVTWKSVSLRWWAWARSSRG